MFVKKKKKKHKIKNVGPKETCPKLTNLGDRPFPHIHQITTTFHVIGMDIRERLINICITYIGINIRVCIRNVIKTFTYIYMYIYNIYMYGYT